MASKGTLIVTGASQGIGAGVVRAFLERDYNVVANSRNITNSGTFRVSAKLALLDGNIGEIAVAAKIVDTAITRFGSIDALVNNAGIFIAKPFTEYTTEDFEALSIVNLKGFLYVTQGSVKQMLAQKRGGSVVSITASSVVNPIAGVLGSVAMITKGGIEAVTRSLAIECKGTHSHQRRSARHCRHPHARERTEGLPEDALADGYNSQRQRHRGRRCLPDRGPQHYWGGAARGRWCAPGPLVSLRRSPKMARFFPWRRSRE
jgi:NADP-dependent 3-hydroxy acid dehydrogenase YdfG